MGHIFGNCNLDLRLFWVHTEGTRKAKISARPDRHLKFVSTGHASLENVSCRNFQKLSQSRDKEVIPASTVALRNDFESDHKIT